MRPLAWQIDVVVYVKATELEGLAEGEDPLRVHEGYQRGMRVAGVKMFLDGSPQGRTAWLTEPYLKPPESEAEDYRGYQTISDERAIAQVRQAFTRGWQVIAHVNGDAAIDQFIMAVRAVCDELGEQDAKHRRPVAVHAQTAREDQIEAFAQLGIIPSFFSMHTFYWGDWYLETVLGPDRATNISPAQWALAQGLKYTSHHDAPVALPNSLAILSSQATRRTRSRVILGPDQRVSMRDALKSLTSNAAHQYFEEDRKGSIETGKLADFVILNRCPLDIDPDNPEEWAGLHITETIRRGKTTPHDTLDADAGPMSAVDLKHSC
jgi:predicted amidohydrolase YtcJ